MFYNLFFFIKILCNIENILIFFETLSRADNPYEEISKLKVFNKTVKKIQSIIINNIINNVPIFNEICFLNGGFSKITKYSHSYGFFIVGLYIKKYYFLISQFLNRFLYPCFLSLFLLISSLFIGGFFYALSYFIILIVSSMIIISLTIFVFQRIFKEFFLIMESVFFRNSTLEKIKIERILECSLDNVTSGYEMQNILTQYINIKIKKLENILQVVIVFFYFTALFATTIIIYFLLKTKYIHSFINLDLNTISYY